MNVSSVMPVFYLSHGGGPCFFMDWSPIGPKDTWYRMEAWLKDFRSLLPETPRAILVVSAHWEESDFTVQRVEDPGLIYDYEGFPPHTYELRYPARGDPALSHRISHLLGAAGIPARENTARGYDHGVFVPLLLMFPEASIPVVQVSLKSGLDPEEHLAMGRALAPLRKEGVLILGSGMSYHNLRALFAGLPVAPGSEEFDSWMGKVATLDQEHRDAALLGWRSAPGALLAHPREEHLIPLMVIAGAAEGDPGAVAFTDTVMGAKNSSISFGVRR